MFTKHEDEIESIIEGESEIFLDRKRFKASQGDMINFPRSIAHGFTNSDDRPARALFMVTSGEGRQKFFEELTTLPPGEPPDMTKITDIFNRYGLTILAMTSGAGAG